LSKLFWLVFKREENTVLLIQLATAMDYAQLRASIALGDAKYHEGYELDDKITRKIPKAQIGKPPSQKQAKALLKKLR
jgi:hypothetical protein